MSIKTIPITGVWIAKVHQIKPKPALVLVSIEVDGKWIEIFRCHPDLLDSHFLEASRIKACINQAAEDVVI